MTNSAPDHHADRAGEIVPSDLLLVHEGLEEDGESWRATLPRPDNLLRRVWAWPPGLTHVAETQAQPGSSTDVAHPTHSRPTQRTLLRLQRVRSQRKDAKDSCH